MPQQGDDDKVYAIFAINGTSWNRMSAVHQDPVRLMEFMGSDDLLQKIPSAEKDIFFGERNVIKRSAIPHQAVKEMIKNGILQVNSSRTSESSPPYFVKQVGD